jgi:hypothetical protein
MCTELLGAPVLMWYPLSLFPIHFIFFTFLSHLISNSLNHKNNETNTRFTSHLVIRITSHLILAQDSHSSQFTIQIRFTKSQEQQHKHTRFTYLETKNLPKHLRLLSCRQEEACSSPHGRARIVAPGPGQAMPGQARACASPSACVLCARRGLRNRASTYVVTHAATTRALLGLQGRLLCAPQAQLGRLSSHAHDPRLGRPSHLPTGPVIAGATPTDLAPSPSRTTSHFAPPDCTRVHGGC